MLSNALIELDRAHLIHPMSSWRGHEARGATILRSAKGAYVTDAQGQVLLDGFSGLWCVNAGYGHESIVRVAAEQMMRLPYATGYFGFGSEPAVRLAATLAEAAPGDLDHVFFTLGGSDAVDTVIRFLRFYAHAIGQLERRHVIALERGYHGSSSTGAGVTALPAFHRDSELPLPWQHHIPSPYPYRSPHCGDDRAIIAASVASLRAKVEELDPRHVAAFVCEPIQGSGGVIVPPHGWLRAMRETCRDLGILFVADEVITGFGRTGPLFACEAEDVAPDMMTLAKGLTSGYCPMGAVLISDRVYRAIADAPANSMPIGHGLTYSGHPVSAAVGLEVMRLYREEGILANGQATGIYFERRLKELASHPLVGDVRSRGMLAGIELVTDKARKSKPDRSLRIAENLFDTGYARGLIFRAFADDVIGLAPPLCCSEADIDLLMERLRGTLDDVLNLTEIRHAAH